MQEEKSIVDAIDVFLASFLIHILKEAKLWISNIFCLFFFFVVREAQTDIHCRNPSLWFATKARGLQGGGPRSRPGSHITCSRECKESTECEGMNSHVPK
jgi:uncharacterized paraquat-inducible protein A